MDYKIDLYIIFGILPSLTWLFYYLRKDLHPEPKKTILRIFLWGSLITVPVFFIQVGLMFLLAKINLDPVLISFVYWFLIIALSEESFKYFVVKFKILNSPDLDEPLDIMLYMVVSALGFAALENILYLFNPTTGLSFDELIKRTLLLSFIRFIGATFLHTLCSALIGYFVAISIYENKKRPFYVILGISFAVALHGLYDLSIMNIRGYFNFIIPAIILLILAFLVFSGFEKLKKMKSISKIWPKK
jgi:RsiW-degrading membrane proteinase PrsW (M82 family)